LAYRFDLIAGAACRLRRSILGDAGVGSIDPAVGTNLDAARTRFGSEMQENQQFVSSISVSNLGVNSA
jgi:hypothetical protein